MPLGTPFFRSQSSYQCLSVKTPEFQILCLNQFHSFQEFNRSVDGCRACFFGMMSDYRLFTCGTHGIMFHSPRSPAPFALTNIGKIAVFAFNTVNDACYFFFRWTLLRFFEDRSKCAYGLKSSLYVELHVAVCVSHCRYPLNIAYQGLRLILC